MTDRYSTKRLTLINRYYKITRFYPFLKNTAIKAGVTIIVFVLLIIGLEIFVLDINSILNNLVATYSPKVIFTVFLISEAILGIVPPEVFIAWASKSVTPWLFLLVLATMSYIGGIISYFIGNRIFLIPSVKKHMENKIAKHIANLRKWGGFFVLMGALLPIPHSLVSLASGLIKYNFRSYLLWALFRYARFAMYA
ncbi:MAG TPA: VTT domain-containing protein, partial [Draconibacterium sp.]|nr:VTT domain-containing protein [Draconibacterium sp.]